MLEVSVPLYSKEFTSWVSLVFVRLNYNIFASKSSFARRIALLSLSLSSWIDYTFYSKASNIASCSIYSSFSASVICYKWASSRLVA